eukprot:Lankesteria_metandrocarpae@DN4338_c0_g2_i2.p1
MGLTTAKRVKDRVSCVSVRLACILLLNLWTAAGSATIETVVDSNVRDSFTHNSAESFRCSNNTTLYNSASHGDGSEHSVDSNRRRLDSLRGCEGCRLSPSSFLRGVLHRTAPCINGGYPNVSQAIEAEAHRKLIGTKSALGDSGGRSRRDVDVFLKTGDDERFSAASDAMHWNSINLSEEQLRKHEKYRESTSADDGLRGRSAGEGKSSLLSENTYRLDNSYDPYKQGNMYSDAVDDQRLVDTSFSPYKDQDNNDHRHLNDGMALLEEILRSIPVISNYDGGIEVPSSDDLIGCGNIEGNRDNAIGCNPQDHYIDRYETSAVGAQYIPVEYPEYKQDVSPLASAATRHGVPRLDHPLMDDEMISDLIDRMEKDGPSEAGEDIAPPPLAEGSGKPTVTIASAAVGFGVVAVSLLGYGVYHVVDKTRPTKPPDDSFDFTEERTTPKSTRTTISPTAATALPPAVSTSPNSSTQGSPQPPSKQKSNFFNMDFNKLFSSMRTNPDAGELSRWHADETTPQTADGSGRTARSKRTASFDELEARRKSSHRIMGHSFEWEDVEDYKGMPRPLPGSAPASFDRKSAAKFAIEIPESTTAGSDRGVSGGNNDYVQSTARSDEPRTSSAKKRGVSFRVKENSYEDATAAGGGDEDDDDDDTFDPHTDAVYRRGGRQSHLDQSKVGRRVSTRSRSMAASPKSVDNRHTASQDGSAFVQPSIDTLTSEIGTAGTGRVTWSSASPAERGGGMLLALGRSMDRRGTLSYTAAGQQHSVEGGIYVPTTGTGANASRPSVLVAARAAASTAGWTDALSRRFSRRRRARTSSVGTRAVRTRSRCASNNRRPLPGLLPQEGMWSSRGGNGSKEDFHLEDLMADVNLDN